MSRSVIALENIKTGEIRYVLAVTTDSNIISYTTKIGKAIAFSGANILGPLKEVKRNIFPNDTRVYTTSAS